MNRRWLLPLLVLTSLTSLTSTSASAAETDPYYAWWSPPSDGTRGLNTAINAELTHALADFNASLGAETASCEVVAVASTVRLAPTAGWFFLGLTRVWPIDFSPGSTTEYVLRAAPMSVYRDAALWPFGHAVPVDPAVAVGDVVFGTDKIAHFFTNGARYYQRFLERRAAGDDEASATAAAIALGIGEEEGWLGQWASGIFSYADLQANAHGLAFYRSLCEGPTPGLRQINGRWRMQPFNIADHVDPCWDEGFETSAFSPADTVAIAAAARQLCPLFHRPEVQRRLRRYRRRGCGGPGIAIVHAMRARGELPDATPAAMTTVCASPSPP